MDENTGPAWLKNGRVDEVRFAKEFLEGRELIYDNKAFFGIEGRIHDMDGMRRMIYDRISPHISQGVSRKVESILDVLSMEAGKKKLEIEETRIHLANGSYHLGDGFTEEKQVCRYRLPVSFRPNTPNPKLWLEFLDQLLEPEDIRTLQEFMGYCLIPTTAAQKMLIITGRGGEGKSRIGVVMRSLLGENMNQGSISKLETNQFARADLEHRLLLLDDDLQMEKLPSTHYIKSIITAEQPMDLERKGIQSYQGLLHCRFMAFGNGNLRAVNDSTYGFYRRQIILKAKPRPADRQDDPYLGKKLAKEADQILLWCLSGLHRLFENDFQFTLSRDSEENTSEAMREADTISSFLKSEGYVTMNPEGCASSQALYNVYRDWCRDNAAEPENMNRFFSLMRYESEKYGLRFDYNIPVSRGRRARGYRGIQILPRI